MGFKSRLAFVDSGTRFCGIGGTSRALRLKALSSRPAQPEVRLASKNCSNTSSMPQRFTGSASGVMKP
jgi:hypothetical protein